MDSTKALWKQIEKIGRNSEFPPYPWDPDQAFTALENVGGVKCGDFMFMGVSMNDHYLMFKNIVTRHYLYIPKPSSTQERRIANGV